MSTPTESTLRAALTKVVKTYDDYRRRGVAPAPAEYADVVDAIESARAVLSAHPARASQEPGSDEFGRFTAWAKPHLWSSDKAAMDLAWLAWSAADRAARPESVDARRWRAFLDFSLGDKECALEDVDIQHIPSGHDGNHWSFIELAWKHPQWTKATKDDANQAIDAAIAKGDQDER